MIGTKCYGLLWIERITHKCMVCNYLCGLLWCSGKVAYLIAKYIPYANCAGMHPLVALT